MFLVGGQRDASFMPEPVSEEGGELIADSDTQRMVGSGTGPDPFASIDDAPDRKSGRSAATQREAARPAPERVTRRGDDWLADVERSMGSDEASTSPPAGVPGEAPADSAEVDPALRVISGGGGQAPRPRVSMSVVRGGVDGEEIAADAPDGDGAFLQLGEEAARRLADDLVAALAATYPAKIVRARADGQWSFHLGEVIRDARDDFHSVVSEETTDRDELFNQALMRLVSGQLEGVDATPKGPAPDAGPAPDSDGPAGG